MSIYNPTFRLWKRIIGLFLCGRYI